MGSDYNQGQFNGGRFCLDILFAWQGVWVVNWDRGREDCVAFRASSKKSADKLSVERVQ